MHLSSLRIDSTLRVGYFRIVACYRIPALRFHRPPKPSLHHTSEHSLPSPFHDNVRRHGETRPGFYSRRRTGKYGPGSRGHFTNKHRNESSTFRKRAVPPESALATEQAWSTSPPFCRCWPSASEPQPWKPLGKGGEITQRTDSEARRRRAWPRAATSYTCPNKRTIFAPEGCPIQRRIRQTFRWPLWTTQPGHDKADILSQRRDTDTCTTAGRVGLAQLARRQSGYLGRLWSRVARTKTTSTELHLANPKDGHLHLLVFYCIRLGCHAHRTLLWTLVRRRTRRQHTHREERGLVSQRRLLHRHRCHRRSQHS